MIKRLRIIIGIGICMLYVKGNSQNREQAQAHIEILSSDSFYGRGYINEGDKIAAEYLKKEFQKLGLKPINTSFLQPLNLSVNTITQTAIMLNDERLVEGESYLLNPNAPSTQLETGLFDLTGVTKPKKSVRKVKRCYKKGNVPVLRKTSVDKQTAQKINQFKKKLPTTTLWLDKNPIYAVGRNQTDDLEIYLKEELWNEKYTDISVSVNATLVPEYSSYNVVGKIEGTEFPDSVVILCGHYDHLGMMGDATFYGANDNASGIAMLLSLAEYFSKNPPRYSLLFIGFGAEEAGLIGSYQFVNNPPEGYSLRKTKFVFNMDLMGSGEDGATIVNATLFPEYFDMLEKINEEKKYLKVLKKRGKAANSDHYFFSEAGIPSFFMYTMGAYKHYHSIEDNANNLQLTEFFDRSFFLIRDFVIAL